MAERDESLGKLDAFLVDVRQARQALGAAQAALDARSDALTTEVTSHGGRLQQVAQGLTALLETFQTLHAESQGTLAALAHAAGRLADARLGAVREALADTRHRFAAGQSQARELMEAADNEWEQEFTESQASLDALDAQAGDMEAESDQVFTELEGRVAATDAALRQTVNEIAAAAEASAEYLAQGLEPYVAAAFAALDGHVEREAQPFVIDAFADLTRSLVRSFDEYDALIEAASQELMQTTDPLLAESTRATETLHRATRSQLERCGRDGLEPVDDESEKSIRAMTRGEDIAANLPPLLPQLVTAREVAERVHELMDVFNPFG
jgi:cell division septum initiation protein DivIVA